jgi:heme/copper-type cytochrome/quinol oxidase subunit 3
MYDKRYKGDHKPGAEEHAEVATAAEAGPRGAPATTHTPAPGTGAPAEAASPSAGGHNQAAPNAVSHGEGPGQAGMHGQPPQTGGSTAAGGPGPIKTEQANLNPEYVDPNAGTGDAAQIRPVVQGPAGLAPALVREHGKAHLDEAQKEELLEKEYLELGPLDKTRTSTFFQIYFLMTGLHGLHVVVGMALIFWILVKAAPPAHRRAVGAGGVASLGLFFLYVGILVHHHPTWIIGVLLLIGAAALFVLGSARRAALAAAGAPGEFGPDYFTPVDIVGLYWHLVDLIWIFLFPLLYLIH